MSPDPNPDPSVLSRRRAIGAIAACAALAVLSGCASERSAQATRTPTPGSGDGATPSPVAAASAATTGSAGSAGSADAGTRLADAADAIVSSLRHTDYQHHERIDRATGRYDCDCNAFVGLMLRSVVPTAYAELPKEADQPRPRAFEYADFFRSLPASGSAGWEPVGRLDGVRRGDVLAWRFPKLEAGHDTGHVMIAAAAPTAAADGSTALRIYDSAATPHFDDTRGPGAGQFPDGVGSGTIRFRVDAGGRPTAFLFAPGGNFTTLPISIGRLRG